MRQEGNLFDPAYASHMKPWVHATGLGLMATVDNNAATLDLPMPFPGAAHGGKPVEIDNRAMSVFPDAVPVGNLQIQKKFDLVEVRPDNFREVLLNCLPEFANNIHTFDLPPPSVQQANYQIEWNTQIA